MAAGFGNTGSVLYSNFGFLTGATAQRIMGLGWRAVSGDITPIGQADSLLRIKVVSGRWDPQPATVPFFMNATTLTAAPAVTTTGTLTMLYPGGSTTGVTHLAGMTAFKYGDMIDDEIMIGECEFLPLGGVVLDGP